MALWWMSFARPRENYVVISEAPDIEAALEKAIPLKNFNPMEWSMEAYEIPPGGPEAKDFKKDTLITSDDLRAKGYLKASEQRQSN